MRKVVSIALFGDADRKDGSGVNYRAYLPNFVLAHHHLFPADEDWELVLHVDPAAAELDFVVAANQEGLLNVVPMGEAVLTRAMLWRMAPVFKPDVDYVFCRDIDALPMPRDRRCCDVFIASNCTVHSIHDSASHAGVMGGLCGFQCAPFRDATFLHSLDDLYTYAAKSRQEWAQHGTDQLVLNRLVDRQQAGLTLLEHRYAGWHSGVVQYAAREVGEYHCRAKSTPVPYAGKARLAVPFLTQRADTLANHLGSAGYDIDQARTFWELHGDASIVEKVLRCERSSCASTTSPL